MAVRGSIQHQRRFGAAILDTVDVGLMLLDSTGPYQAMNRRHGDFMALAYPEGHAGEAGQLGKVYAADGPHLGRARDADVPRDAR